jgi:type IV secretory pathway protease TraF
MLQSKAGYIDARPLTASSAKPLATHGRTIHWVKLRRTQCEQISSELLLLATELRTSLVVRFVPILLQKSVDACGEP